jgi:two-component system, chemotaxis family, chemotaxis protein CheY
MDHDDGGAFHRIAGPAARPADKSEALRGLTVLVVEDKEDMRSIVCTMLRRMKIKHVLEAASGEQALEHLSTQLDAVTLVICDWNLPGISGMDLFKQVHARQPNMPFLMLTGRADLRSVLEAKKAGVHSYLAKPVSPAELKAKLISLIDFGLSQSYAGR